MRLNPTLALWCLIAVSILCLTVRPQYARAEELVGECEDDGTAWETYDCEEEYEDCEDSQDCDDNSTCDESPECEPDEQCEDEVDECEAEDFEECEPEEMEECQEGETPDWYGWAFYADECPEGTEECDECEDESTDCDESDDCSHCDESEDCVDECDDSTELECDDDCPDEFDDCSECDDSAECSDEEECDEELNGSCTSPTAYWATHNAETTGPSFKPWPLSENTVLCGKRWIDVLTTASARAAAFTGAYTEDVNDDRWNLLAAEWISAKLSLASGVRSDYLFDALLTQAEEILSKCEIVEQDDDAAYHDWNVLYAWNSGLIGPGTCCSDEETEYPECPYVPPVSGGDGESGDGESSDGESGDGESGDGNGDGNSGDGNGDGESGDGNSGDGESGDGESGDGESGDGNSGDGNSGDGESGDGNSGDGESGDGNSGDGESGDGNSGDGESGDGESGDGDNEQGQTSAPTPPPSTPTSNDEGTVKAQAVSNGRPSLSDDDGAIGGIVAGLVGGVIVAGVVALVLGLALFGLLKLSGGAAGVGGFAPDAGALAGGTMNPAYAAGGAGGNNQLYA